MDKIEARSKTMMDKIEARRVREEYEKGTIARKHDDRGFPRLQVHEVPSYIAQRWNRYLARDPPSQTIWDWKRYLARDPPSYDSGTLLSEADAETMMDKIEARSKWLKAKQWLKSCTRRVRLQGTTRRWSARSTASYPTARLKPTSATFGQRCSARCTRPVRATTLN